MSSLVGTGAATGLSVALLLAPACTPETSELRETLFEGETMGTTYSVTLAGELPEDERRGLGAAVHGALEDVDESMSNYLPDSELSRLNRAPVGEAFPLSTELFFVLSEARRISAVTAGAFDVTVSPLVRLWGFGPGAHGSDADPTPGQIAAARERVGYRSLRLADDPPRATKERALELDLSAIAKGYGVDRVAELLLDEGYEDFLVEVGGEVRTAGASARGGPWRVGIEKPLPGVRVVFRILPLSGPSLATSGDYRNFYERDGRLLSHLIDPRTARPVAHALASVSVVHESCMTADALASALLVMGPDDGYRLAEREGWAVLFLSRSTTAGEPAIAERATPVFAERFIPAALTP